MYFPKTSNSTLTRSLTLRKIKLVDFKVFGIIDTWKPSFKIFDTVKDTPLIVIDPFDTKNFLHFFCHFTHYSLDK